MFTAKELSSAMAKPTFTALQRLKELVGYPKGTPDYCVLLDVPVCGQGRWRLSDKHLILESFSDSDWSSNQVRRRSTSCGVHVLNGAFLFGSSRTQRVVSLSSCESELHAMISTLSDAMFLKRCIEFVFGAEVEHCMFHRLVVRTTASSEAGYRKGETFVRQSFVDPRCSQKWIGDPAPNPYSLERERYRDEGVGCATNSAPSSSDECGFKFRFLCCWYA